MHFQVNLFACITSFYKADLFLWSWPFLLPTIVFICLYWGHFLITFNNGRLFLQQGSFLIWRSETIGTLAMFFIKTLCPWYQLLLNESEPSLPTMAPFLQRMRPMARQRWHSGKRRCMASTRASSLELLQWETTASTAPPSTSPRPPPPSCRNSPVRKQARANPA